MATPSTWQRVFNGRVNALSESNEKPLGILGGLSRFCLGPAVPFQRAADHHWSGPQRGVRFLRARAGRVTQATGGACDAIHKPLIAAALCKPGPAGTEVLIHSRESEIFFF